jgi:hypothetical protein
MKKSAKSLNIFNIQLFRLAAAVRPGAGQTWHLGISNAGECGIRVTAFCGISCMVR